MTSPQSHSELERALAERTRELADALARCGKRQLNRRKLLIALGAGEDAIRMRASALVLTADPLIDAADKVIE